MGKLSLAQQIEEMSHLLNLLDFRIGKQEQLLEKIVTGKWKSTHVSDKVLYGLAQHDLKLLKEKRTEANLLLPKLKDQLEEEMSNIPKD